MADGLTVQIQKHFASGTIIEADLRLATGAPAVTVLFGPSGSGKTTVLRCLAGLERPERGVICYGDEVWYDALRGICLSPQKRRIGYLFQEYALFPHLTVKGNLEYGLSHEGKGQRQRRVAALSKLFKLEGLENRYPRQLSGGQLQRVALARAVAPEPRLLLLDEPLSALDDPTRGRLRSELRGLLLKTGVPTLLVTHDRMEAIALGDQLAVIVEGRIQQIGLVQEVFSYPASHAVARSVGVENVLPGTVVGTSEGLLTLRAQQARLFAVDPGDVDGPEVYLCIRAEEVILETDAAGRDSARNHLTGRITSITLEGPLVRVRLDCGIPLIALITRQAREQLTLKEGDTVKAVIKATSVHLVPRTSTFSLSSE
jgi:molybdate transport system ATP-binding protein